MTDCYRGGVSHPESIAYRINGYWVSGDFQPIDIVDIVGRAICHKDIFVKQAEDSAGGHGVAHFSMPIQKNELYSALKNVRENSVVQIGIIQHEIMASLNPSSVNTIRVLSHLMTDGKIKIRSVVVRMGRKGTFVDNASSGGVTVGVEDSGRLKEIGYDVEGSVYEEHPDTKRKFSDIVIPNYKHILNTVERLHWQIPQFRLLSWDIALNSDADPILIEVNMHSGQLDFHQLNNGPVFGDDTETILNEVFKRK